MRRIYQLPFMALVVADATTSSSTVRKMGDIGIGLTTWINVIVHIILFPQALALFKGFEKP